MSEHIRSTVSGSTRAPGRKSTTPAIPPIGYARRNRRSAISLPAIAMNCAFVTT